MTRRPALAVDNAALLDALACRTVHETYSYAEITRDPDLFASVWTEDALFGTVRGRDNIRAAAVGFFKDMESISDLRISPAGWHVDVDGDTATGRFYIVSQLKVPRPDGTARIMHMDATYHAEFARTPEGWRLSRLCGLKNPDLFHDTDFMTELEFKPVSFEA